MHMGAHTHTHTHTHAYNLPLSPSHAHTVNTCILLVLAGKATGTATWRFGTTFGIQLDHEAWSLTSALPTTGLGQAATCCKMATSHTPRTLTARCLLLHSVRSTPMGNNSLTIRTFLFSPQSLVPPPACMASFCVFFFYRHTGRLRHTSLPLECHRKTSTRKHSGSSARHSTTA